jgi:transposase
MEVVSEKLIVSIAIFSHGNEDFSNPFMDPDVEEFYKDNVRVFSRSCMPGIPSLTGWSQHFRETDSMLFRCQEGREKSTNENLSKHMEELKPNYVSSVKYVMPDASVHADKTCGVSSFLSEKIFDFTPDYGIRQEHFGIFIVDARYKITYNDGTVKYDVILDPGKLSSISKIGSLNLINPKVMAKFLNNYLRLNKTREEIGEIYNNLFRKNRASLSGIYRLCKSCGIDYLNIVDNSCRQSLTGYLSPDEAEEIYNREQMQAKDLTEFGGKRKSKSTKKTRKTKKTKAYFSKKNIKRRTKKHRV